jgi:hypothetical protein
MPHDLPHATAKHRFKAYHKNLLQHRRPPHRTADGRPAADRHGSNRLGDATRHSYAATGRLGWARLCSEPGLSIPRIRRKSISGWRIISSLQCVIGRGAIVAIGIRAGSACHSDNIGACRTGALMAAFSASIRPRAIIGISTHRYVTVANTTVNAATIVSRTRNCSQPGAS